MGSVRERLEGVVVRHPTVPLALRAAGAAVLAWLAVLPLGGVADEYPYYAPLGAVVSVSTTVMSSIRTAMQTFASLACGALLAVGGLLLPVPDLLALGLVVGVGTLLTASPRLTLLGSWVPISAIFILVLGQEDPVRFAVAYLGLTTFGAVIGTAINAIIPPVRFAPTRQAQEALRSALVDQIEELADGLEADPLPTSEDWQARRYDLEPAARRVEELVAEAAGGPRVNWRVRRHQEEADRLRQQGRALVGLALLVADLAEFLAREEQAGREEQAPLGPELRPEAARALRSLAAVLRSVEDSVADEHELERAWKEAHALVEAVREVRHRTGRDLFGAGTLVTGIQRTLQSVTPLPSEDA